MSNIVVVEPYRVLQQAITLSLAQDHKVQVRESMTANELQGLEQCDLLVVDAASLAERNFLTAEFLRALQGCATPTLWLEDEKTLDRPKKKRLQVLKKPLEQKAFREAVANLLSAQNRPEPEAENPTPTPPGKGSPKNLEKKESTSEQTTQGFIELTDVVGEPPSGSGKKAPKKSN